MLRLHSLDEVEEIITNEFAHKKYGSELVTLRNSIGRVLEEDVIAPCFIPPYNRSLVDGYAVVASSAFGCSESIPALFNKVGNVNMGEMFDSVVGPDECVYVPTGGHVPANCDAVVMIEDAEDYCNGLIGVLKPPAPGEHMVYKGEEVREGEIIFPKGKRIQLKDIGILLACGIKEVNVRKKPIIGVLSSGDEIISEKEDMTPGKLRDINGPLITADLENKGINVIFYGVIKDNQEILKETLQKAVNECDIVITSGGTSVGIKDRLPIIVDELGELLVHGIAVKPGKPTFIGKVNQKPVIGLPGHPTAAFYIYIFLVQKLLSMAMEEDIYQKKEKKILKYSVSSNHGKESFIAVSVQDDKAVPVRGNSGMISILSKSEGFIRIGRNSEGLQAGVEVDVYML